MYSGRQIPSSKTAFVRALCLAGLSVPLFSTPASAGEWTITPRVDLEQSVTDNARSASKGLEADLITTVTAGLDLNGRGRRAQVNLNVNLSRDIFWDNTDLNGVRQSLLGDANVEAVEDFVFIDTRASVTQQSLQRGGGISASDRNVGTADQSTVVNYSIAPDFKHRYGNWADSDLRYTFNETRFFDSDVGSATAQPGASRSHEIRALVRSGPRFTTLTWELSSSRTFTNNSSNRECRGRSGARSSAGWPGRLA